MLLQKGRKTPTTLSVGAPLVKRLGKTANNRIMKCMPQETSRNNPSRDDIYAFLSGQKLAILSTVSQAGLPDAVPIYFLVAENFEITLLSSDNSQKNRNIAHQNRVALTCTDEQTKEMVQIQGVATVQQSPALVTRLLSRLAAKLNADEDFETVLPLLKHSAQETVVVVIRPVAVRMRRYHTRGMDETTLTFEKPR